MQSKTVTALTIGALILLVIFGALTLFKDALQKEKESIAYSNITSKDLNEILNSQRDVYLLDVHIPEQKHIIQTDDFIPYTELAANKTKLPKDKNAEIIVYCRSGSMSEIAAKELVDMGYTNVSNLLGGVNAWKAQGGSVDSGDLKHKTPDYNKPIAESHKMTFDFGKVARLGGVVQTTFELENHGRKKLIIGDISTSCGCTTAKIDKTELGFNEVATITVYFDPNFHKEPQGRITRSVFVETNDVAASTLQFDIFAEIVE